MFSGKSEELMRRLRRVGYARKSAILIEHALHRIDQQERDIAATDRLDRSQRAVILDGSGAVDFAAHAGGIDQTHAMIVVHEDRIDRIARRAGHVAYNRTLFPENRVEQRGLADVGLSDKRDRNLILGLDEASVGR